MRLLNSHLLISILALAFLNSCGQPVCVAGFGQCAAPEKPVTVTPSSTPLNLESDKSEIAVGETAKLTISGGTSPYKVEFLSTPVGEITPTLTSTFVSTTQYTYKGTSVIAVVLKVTDSASSPASKQITINVKSATR